MVILLIASLAICAHASLHHLFVGTRDGQALYSLEMDTEARMVYMISARDASGPSPSLALDNTRKYLFSTRPTDGTLTRHSIAPTYELIQEGTMQIPSSCNTTEFISLHLNSPIRSRGIWGTASTGACSTVFSITPDGYATLRSEEIAGDVHSIAWGSNDRNLRALNSQSSDNHLASIISFRITDDQNLNDVVAVDVLKSIANPSQIISHPIQEQVYLVARDSNELIRLSLNGDMPLNASAVTSRYNLVSKFDKELFQTSSLAISASRRILWTLSQTTEQAIVNAFALNTTGEVIGIVARAGWKGDGDGYLTASPFLEGDVVAVTNSPKGYVTLLGLHTDVSVDSSAINDGSVHSYLCQIPVSKEKRHVEGGTSRIESYGRASLDEYANLGESIWIN